MNPALALILTNIIWGAAAPIFKFALQNIPPFTLAFFRFFFAAFLLLPAVSRKWKKVNLNDFLTIVAASFFGITINIAFFFLGLARGVSINAPVIGSTGPLILFFIAIFFLKEKVRPKILAGMALSFFGVLIIILSPLFLEGKQLAISEIWANIFFIISTIGIILSPLFSRRVLKKVGVFQFTFISFVFAAATFFPFYLYERRFWSLSELNLNGWVGIVFGVIFSSVLAYLLFFWGTSKIRAQEIGIFTYIDPVAALIIAIPLLGEIPTIYYFIGSFLVFFGIFIAEGRLHWHPFHKLKK